MSPLEPISHALSGIVAGTHALAAALGLDPGGGAAWLLSIAGVVVVVRLALLPLAIRGVRQAHAGARARPHLKEVTERFRGRTDPDSMRELFAARREVNAEHGISRLGCLPLLLQIPAWMALYHLLAQVAGGTAVGALTPALVASFGAATLAGVPLAAHGYLGGGAAHLAVVATLAGTAAALSFVTQRFVVAPNTVLADLPDAMVQAQQLMPLLSAAGLLLTGGIAPVALLAYWVCNAGWTLAQSAVITRWFPTPGSPAAARRAAAA
ncbi:membrane protein insertase YidC [Pimelobacter simplex]|uniref:membrane protein insertase YidC n=1 Tax=Nocardioides simplex TaxID=2045 RepID=UPI00366F16AB